MSRRFVGENRRLRVLTVSFLAAAGLNIWDELFHCMRDLTSCVYIGVILAWALSISHRIVYTHIRRWLLTASGFMMLLFVLRLCKYTFFIESVTIQEYCRYAYYIPFTAVPLCTFCAAVSVGTPRELLPKKRMCFLWSGQCLLGTLMMTNRLHGRLFHLSDGEVDWQTHGGLYAIVVLWCVGLGMTAFILLLYRCRVSAAKRKWYVPAFFMVTGTVLLAWYFIVGGSPELYGVKLYTIQEIFCFIFIFSFESFIHVGLIPSNSEYTALFRLSHIGAEISDNDGTPLYRSLNYLQGNNIRRHQMAISGGSVVWTEDMSVICRLNENIQNALDDINEENELIRQENAIREERIRYETQNRLYDSIARRVHTQAETIQTLLCSDGKSEETFQDDLRLAAVMGAYVKRVGNFMLIAGENGMISSAELVLSIRESLEYVSLSGKTCDVSEINAGLIPLPLAAHAYMLLERVLERRWRKFQTVAVILRAAPRFTMRILLDDASLLTDEDLHMDTDDSLKLRIRQWCEDDTLHIELMAEGEERL